MKSVDNSFKEAPLKITIINGVMYTIGATIAMEAFPIIGENVGEKLGTIINSFLNDFYNGSGPDLPTFLGTVGKYMGLGNAIKYSVDRLPWPKF